MCDQKEGINDDHGYEYEIDKKLVEANESKYD